MTYRTETDNRFNRIYQRQRAERRVRKVIVGLIMICYVATTYLIYDTFQVNVPECSPIQIPVKVKSWPPVEWQSKFG